MASFESPTASAHRLVARISAQSFSTLGLPLVAEPSAIGRSIAKCIRLARLVMVVLLILWGSTERASAQSNPYPQSTELAASLLRAVNRVRDSLHVAPLKDDPILSKAAVMQAEYCKQLGDLSHLQEGKRRLLTPWNRVVAAGGRHDGVAENLLYLYPEDDQDLDALAQEMAWEWVHSPGHFANMTSKAHRLSGLGFAYDEDEGRLYACQVFADAEWRPKKVQVTKRAYGILPYDGRICKRLSSTEVGKHFRYGYAYSPASKPGAKSEVHFAHEDKDYVMHVLGPKKGAIASDIVFRDQFPCGGPNTLHGSPYHDGYLQRPRNMRYLMRHMVVDTAQKRLLQARTARVTPVSADSIQINVVLTQSKHFCSYTFPISMEAGWIFPELLSMPPDTIPVAPRPQYEMHSLNFRVPFRKGVSQPRLADVQPMLDSLRAHGAEALSLQVMGWASIEGPLATNQTLYQARAENILAMVQATQSSEIHLGSVADENWAAFFRDIKGTDFEWLSGLSHQQVREQLERNPQLEAALEPILSAHRYADVDLVFRVKLETPPPTNAELMDSLVAAMQHKQPYLALELQTQAIHRFLAGELEADQLLRIDIPKMPGFKRLLYNQHWIAQRTMQPSPLDNLPMRDHLMKGHPLYELSQLYRMAVDYSMGWNRRSINPVKISQGILQFRKLGISSAILQNMELLYAIGNANANNASGKVDFRVFESIVQLYHEGRLTVKDAVDLGRFFNRLHGSAFTISFLRPFLTMYADHEDLIFLFAWTAAHHLDLIAESEWLDWMQKAHDMNPARWKAKVDHDWQLLRWERVKGMYCGCAVI